jgi:hypothetical protein
MRLPNGYWLFNKGDETDAGFGKNAQIVVSENNKS